MNGDAGFSPWPAPNRRIEFRLRRATWISARPMYGRYPLTALRRFLMLRFIWPFFTFSGANFHFYLGWKPISLNDPGFYWRAFATEAVPPFVEASARFGWGEIG